MLIEIDLGFTKLSAKKSFLNLRSGGPYFASAINTNIQVSKRFFDHIAHHIRRRNTPSDLVNRLLIIPFVPEILLNGMLKRTRISESGTYFEINLVVEERCLVVIVLHSKKSKQYLLLSCFTKNNPS